jgi:ankyrin repeat protein
MTNVLAREAWNIALKGTESVALSKWPRYSSLDKFKSLHWSMNRRVALEGIKLWKVADRNGRVATDVRGQVVELLHQPKFVDIAVMLVESRSIDVNMSITDQGHKCTLLCIASIYGRLPVVHALLHAGADVDKAMDNGATPLYMASQNKHLPVVQALLQGGADVNEAMDDGGTPLYVASQVGHQPVVQALLQGGADADKGVDSGDTPLIVASGQCYLPVVQALLQAGADVNKATDNGATALYIASMWGHLPVVQALLQAGADADKTNDGFTPQYIASRMGHTATALFLESFTQQAAPSSAP